MRAIDRRRVMVKVGGGPSYDENSYVQDGLVFQLDGIAKGTTDSDKWIDLKGGVVFGNPVNVTPTTDGYVIGTSSQATPQGYMPVTSGTVPTGSGYTIEFCMEEVFKKAQDYLFVTRASDTTAMHLYFSSANLYWMKGESIYLFPSANRGGKHTISLNSSRGIRNYANMSTNGTSTLNRNVSSACIGHPTAGTIYGTLHAIRIYSRQLTADEMIANQQVDNVRFSLGLT